MQDLFNAEEYTEFDLLAELADEPLVAENGAKEDPTDEKFAITEERHVIWFNERMEDKARRINFYTGMRDRKLSKLENIFRREAERIQEEHAKQCEPYKRDIVWMLNRFGTQVKQLLPNLLKKGAKSKKWGNIQIGHRTVSEKIQVVDDDALKEWAIEQEDPDEKLVKSDIKVNLNEMVKRYKDTGEIPPGTRKVPAREQFFYSVHGMQMTDILGNDWLNENKIENPLEEVAVTPTEPEDTLEGPPEAPEGETSEGDGSSDTAHAATIETPPL